MEGSFGKWWEARTNLEKTLLALSIILLLTSVIMIVVGVTSHGSSSNSNPGEGEHVCMSQKCIKTAGDIISMADFSADPCQDFYQFACGQYMATHSAPLDSATASVEHSSVDAVRLRLKNWLESTSGVNTTIYRKAKVLYRTCINFGKSVEGSHMVLEKAIKEEGVGKWPFLDRYWDETTESIERTLSSLALLGVPVAFELSVVPDSRAEGKYVIRMSPGRPFLPMSKANDVRGDPMLKSYVESVLLLLGVPKARVSQAAEDVLTVEAYFIRVKEHENKDCGGDRNDFKEERFDSLEIMDRMLGELNWTSLMLYVYDELGDLKKVAQNLTVELYCRYYIREYVGHLTGISPRILHNYLGWRFLFAFAQYLGQPFYRLNSDYQDYISSADGPPVYRQRWKECVSLVEDTMLPVIGAAYRESEVPEEILKEKMKIAASVRTSMSEWLSSVDWLDDNEKDFLKQKVAESRFDVAAAKFSMKMEEVSQWFSALNLQDDHLMLNMLRIQRFITRKELEKLVTPSKPRLNWDLLSFTSSGSLQYEGSNIAVHFDKIRPPYLRLHLPSYLNYGAFATYLAHELLRYLSTFDLPVKGRNDLKLWDVMKMRRNVASCKSELRRPHDSNAEGENDDLTFSKTMMELDALRTSYWAFKRQDVEKNALPGLEHSNEQLFFLSYAQSFCEAGESEVYDKDYARNDTLSSRLRVTLALRNFQKFSDSYECPSDSAMNPSSRCEAMN